MKQQLLRFIFSLSLTKQLSWINLVVWGLLLFIADPLKIQAPSPRGYIISCAFSLLIGCSLSWILCVLGELLCKFRVGVLFYLWHFGWSLFLVLYSISELFLISFFNLQWNAFTFQLINETTREESLGFIETYSGSWQFSALLSVGCLILAICIWTIIHFKNKNVINPKRISFLRCSFATLFFLFICIEGRCFTFDASVNYSRSDKLIRRSGIWNLYQSILKFNEGKDQLDICVESQNNLEIIGYSNTSENIVLIIGETFNRHHSDLYGYKLQTNPLIREKEPIVFTDVITPYNATTLAFRSFLSFEEMGGVYKWYETPLFPALFKFSGYNVVFYSNQYVVEGGLDFYDASAGFFNHPAIYSKLFDERNHQKHAFDMQLVDEYKANRSKIEKETNNLIIFHLEGQHSPAVERYPKECAKFSSINYDRPELTTSQKQYIADYDNATLYNDSVVSEIVSLFEEKEAIIIYFADHGEEIYDFRDKAGRFSDFNQTGANGMKNQLDIPFMVFTTNKYKNEHPDIVASVESAKDNPFMIDYLPHLLLWLGGINTNWYNKTKNLFSDSYDCTRSRLVASGSLNYDDICK